MSTRLKSNVRPTKPKAALGVVSIPVSPALKREVEQLLKDYLALPIVERRKVLAFMDLKHNRRV